MISVRNTLLVWQFSNSQINYLNPLRLMNTNIVGILVDLKKASDTVNHSILLDKLQFYGIKVVYL